MTNNEATPSEQQRRELIELAKKATPRPYQVNTLAGRPNREIFSEANIWIADTGCGPDLDDAEIEANTAYLVAAANLAPGLVREVERLREGDSGNATKL